MKLIVKTLFLLSITLFSGNLAAQSFYKERVSRDNILTIGLGPAFAYLDNGGQYRDFNFEIKPAFSVAMTKKLNQTFDFRTTLGIQGISSGGNPSPQMMDMWQERNASFTAKGSVYYFDFIPSINLINFSNHMNRSLFNLYGGFGLGIMYARTEQTKSFIPEEEPSKQQITTGYVPVRAGLSYRLGPYSDIAGEGTMMWTFTDNLDGNVGFNRYGDHLFQAQIVYRRYFVPKDKK